jgi:predicted SnoaL-like aldol condensation-catalyzing enzyme
MDRGLTERNRAIVLDFADLFYRQRRVLVDGDLAMVHLHARLSPESPGGAVADLFRLADGKIVEHWDILQPVPENCANPHPMF